MPYIFSRRGSQKVARRYAEEGWGTIHLHQRPSANSSAFVGEIPVGSCMYELKKRDVLIFFLAEVRRSLRGGTKRRVGVLFIHISARQRKSTAFVCEKLRANEFRLSTAGKKAYGIFDLIITLGLFYFLFHISYFDRYSSFESFLLISAILVIIIGKVIYYYRKEFSTQLV